MVLDMCVCGIFERESPSRIFIFDNLLFMFGDKLKTPVITSEIWNSLNDREKDFMRLVHAGKYTDAEICRYLYINSKVTYWRFRGRVHKKITK